MLMVVVIRRRQCMVYFQGHGEWRERQQDNHQREGSRAREGPVGRSLRKMKCHERGASTISVQRLSIWTLLLPRLVTSPAPCYDSVESPSFNARKRC